MQRTHQKLKDDDGVDEKLLFVDQVIKDRVQEAESKEDIFMIFDKYVDCLF